MITDQFKKIIELFEEAKDTVRSACLSEYMIKMCMLEAEETPNRRSQFKRIDHGSIGRTRRPAPMLAE